MHEDKKWIDIISSKKKKLGLKFEYELNFMYCEIYLIFSDDLK